MFRWRRGKKRNSRAKGQVGRGCIPDQVDVRPEIVEEKSRVGDWEGDAGSRHRGAVRWRTAPPLGSAFRQAVGANPAETTAVLDEMHGDSRRGLPTPFAEAPPAEMFERDGSRLQTVSNLKSTMLRSSRPNSMPIRWTGTPGRRYLSA